MYKTSLSGSKFDKRVIKRLEQSVHAIHALYDGNLIEIDVFGSYSKGSSKKYSSIDLLVIIGESEDRFVKRNATLQRLLNEGDQIPLIDPLVYTQDEMVDLLKKRESFLISAIKESMVIWNGFNEILLSELKDSNALPSRFMPTAPHLGEIEF
jgi:predicted nucleotidyltransferase